MDDRRKDTRDKVLFGGVASHEAAGPKELVVRDISEHGARLEFKTVARLPKNEITLNIARKSQSFLARVIWWRDNIVGVAFTDPPVESAKSVEIEERLRKSEKKKIELQRQIKKLLDR